MVGIGYFLKQTLFYKTLKEKEHIEDYYLGHHIEKLALKFQ